jgi:hypothetical protein
LALGLEEPDLPKYLVYGALIETSVLDLN